MIQSLKNLILETLFPATCLTCPASLESHERNWAVCGACLQSVPVYDAFICPVCTRRMHPTEAACHPHALYTLAAATHYKQEKVQAMIHQFKYKEWLRVAEPIAMIFTDYLRHLPYDWRTYTVVPVPLASNREFKRGFNQAAVLASAVSRALYLPLIKNNLTRVKDTDSQTEKKDYRAREQNLEKAFHIKTPGEFKNKNILLVDDVWTSGATMNEAARMLKASGAKKIIAAVIARAR